MASMSSLGVTLSRRRRRKIRTLRKIPVMREASRGKRMRTKMTGGTFNLIKCSRKGSVFMGIT
jgi:hypothetical protein